MTNYYRFEQQFFAYFENLKRNIGAMPLYLGTGSGAGATITGQLPQIKVSYDYEELATNTTSGSPSILDNLNHIRYDVETLQDAYLSGAGLSGGGGLTQGHIIYDEDVEFTQREKLVLSGAGITVVDDPSNDATRVEIESVLSFPELTDTPDGPYVTESGKYIKINSDGTALEYGTPPIWGRNILRLDAGGDVTGQYDSSETGLRSALSDSANGDVILIPPQTITIANDGITINGTGALVIPDGVCVRGISREKTVIYANISTATASDRCLIYMEGTSYLENLTVNYTRSTNAGDDAYAIYRTIDSIYNTGVSFTNITAIATGVRANGVYAQIYNASNKIRVAVDNSCFMVYGGAGSLNKLKGYSNSNREPVIVRNSVFYVDDSSVESGTTSANVYGLRVESNSVTNRVIIQDCRCYSHITDPFSNYTSTRSYGLTGSGFNYDLNSCTSIAINDSTCTQAGALAIGISNQDDLEGKILNCVGIATSTATLTGNETLDYVTYSTYGLSPRNSIVEGGYFEGVDNNTGKALGIHLYSSDTYIYNAVAKGDDGDIYIYNSDNTYLYSCQYDTITKHSTPPSGSQTVIYLKGDRSTYTVDDFHADDIEDDTLTRHLPLPTISGYVAVATGNKWILDQVSGAGGGGVDTFLELTDTPVSYAGEGGKVVSVKSTQDGLEFVAQSGGGDMLKSVYDTDDNGIVDEAETVTWSGVTGKPSTFPPSTHDHDDRYYTETEVDNKLALQDEFTELTDTPTVYGGAGGKVVAVKDTEDGLEFVVQSGAGSGAGASEFTELTDTPSSYSGQAGKSVIVASGEAGLEFTTISGGGSLPIYDNDEFKVTGSAISFDNHLDVTASGLVAHVTTKSTFIPGVYVSSFFDESDEKLHILYSDGGLEWADLGVDLADTLRDPSILYHNDKWWIAHTHDGAPTDVIPILSSDDLLIWNAVTELDTSTMGGTGSAWSPEWFVDTDNSVYLFITIGNVGSHKIYETHPTNDAWTTWSNLVEVTGTGFPADMIDAFVVKIGTVYYLWYKDDDTDYICYATSSSLLSGYTEQEDGDWAGFGGNREGECLVQLDRDTWRIYFNTTLTNGIYYSESGDEFATWTSPVAITDLANLSHGTILQVSNFSAFKNILDVLGYDTGGTIEEEVGTIRIGASISRSSSLSIPNGSPTAISWNNEIRDDGGCWSLSNPTKFIAPVEGWYTISSFVWWAANNSNGRRLYILVNGTTTAGRQSVVSAAGHNDVANNVSAQYYLDVDDYVEIIADQNSGSALNIASGAQAHFVRVGSALNTLLIYDDDVFKVTGTAISFGDNLDVTVSGSVASVSGSGGASDFVDLSDTPSSYSGQAGKCTVVNDTEDGLEFTTISGAGGDGPITWDDTTTEAGQTSNRTTGGTFSRQTMPFWAFQPLSITEIKWDLNSTGTYSMYLTSGQYDTSAISVVASEVVSSTGVHTFTPDDTHLVLDAGRYFLTLKRTTGAANWKDTNVGHKSTELYYSLGIYYDGSWFDSYTPPVAFVAYKGLFNYPGSGAGGGTGASEFVDLTDTPSDYSGQAGKHLVVSSEEDAVEFTALDTNLISGAGTDNYVAVFDSPNSVIGTSDLQFDGQALTINAGLVVNDAGVDVDSRFEGNTEENLLYVNAGIDGIGIGCIGASNYRLDIQAPTASMRVKSSTGTNHVMMHVENAGGGTAIGKSASDGGGLLGSAEDYSSLLYTWGAHPLQFGVNSAIVATWYADHRIGFGLVPTANMLGLSIEAGLLTLKETTTPTADTDYGKIYTKSDNDLYFQDGAGIEHNISSGAGGGADKFTDLIDTPSDYTGQVGKSVVVASGETSLEFVTISGGGADDLLDLTDTPTTYSGASGKSLVVNDGEDGVEFVTVSGGGSGSVSTLLVFTALHAEFPSSNNAVFDTRNLHNVLDFDDTTDQSTIFSAVMPRDYPGDGLMVYIHFAMTTASGGGVVWDVAFERIGNEQQDIDSDSFASAVSSGTIVVPSTSGLVKITSVTFDDGAEIDNISTGDGFRMKVTRDADNGNDDATGDAELLYVEVKAT